MKTRFGLTLAIAAATAALASPPRANADDLLKLTIGQRGNWDTAITQLGTKAGIFKKNGIELEMVYTSGSGETLQPVIGGAVDPVSRSARWARSRHPPRARRCALSGPKRPALPTTGTPRHPRR